MDPLEQHLVTRPADNPALDPVVIACCTSRAAAEAARRLLLDEVEAITGCQSCQHD